MYISMDVHYDVVVSLFTRVRVSEKDTGAFLRNCI